MKKPSATNASDSAGTGSAAKSNGMAASGSARPYRKTNLHTHTNFCDGKCSAETMVQAAIAQGITLLGFTSHSMYPFATDWHLAVASHADYCAEIHRLQAAYADQLHILLGFEVDYLAPIACPRMEHYATFAPDYLIGSVHYIGTSDGVFTVDGSPAELSNGIRTRYGGNVQAAISHYFALEREMLSKGDFAILGHADLVRKYNAALHLFDENDTWYQRELKATAAAIAHAGVIAEINTGGMARAGLPSPYPSPYFLSLLHERGVPVTISSDAHTAEHIAAFFDVAREYAKKADYTEFAVPNAGSFEFYSL